MVDLLYHIEDVTERMNTIFRSIHLERSGSRWTCSIV